MSGEAKHPAIILAVAEGEDSFGAVAESLTEILQTRRLIHARANQVDCPEAANQRGHTLGQHLAQMRVNALGLRRRGQQRKLNGCPANLLNGVNQNRTGKEEPREVLQSQGIGNTLARVLKVITDDVHNLFAAILRQEDSFGGAHE